MSHSKVGTGSLFHSQKEESLDLRMSAPKAQKNLPFADQDMVARHAKFMFYYKRGGHRVIINRMGELIVRPNAIEASLRLIPFTGSLHQHLLTSYVKSVASIVIRQFTSRFATRADRQSAADLMKRNKLLRVRVFIEFSEAALVMLPALGGLQLLFALQRYLTGIHALLQLQEVFDPTISLHNHIHKNQIKAQSVMQDCIVAEYGVTLVQIQSCAQSDGCIKVGRHSGSKRAQIPKKDSTLSQGLSSSDLV